jgi:hypothetical protein
VNGGCIKRTPASDGEGSRGSAGREVRDCVRAGIGGGLVAACLGA